MDLVASITLLVLAVFLGVELITKVPPTLHTPLMSGSNAISGITVVGALVAAGADHRTFTTVLGFAAVTLAMVNVVGGFLVTHRMLSMFGSKRARTPRRDASASNPRSGSTDSGERQRAESPAQQPSRGSHSQTPPARSEAVTAAESDRGADRS